MGQKKRIGLFGGTFDPVHLGHTIVAEWMQSKLNLDEVHFIPNYIHPFAKREDILNSAHRLKMLELAVAGYPDFKICRFEIDRNEISYSIDTIRYFQKQFPDHSIYYLIGADNINEFDYWKEADEIFNLAKVVVHNRKSDDINIPDQFEYIESPLIEISSSQIRKHIKKGLPYHSFLHPDVYEYIEQHKLYR
ncbi:MAG: nicotinate (nicotinamide) nucleotide adenylyltransferase [Calditrichaceae bacterium]